MTILCVLLLLMLIRRETFAQSITPLGNKLLKSEAEKVTLSCKYEGAVSNLHWYRQYLGSKPEFLAFIFPHGATSDPLPPRLLPKVDKNSNIVSLEILNAEVSDSALYYCALTPTVTGNTSTLYKNNLNNKTISS
ncbi:hypothetical protein R3I93_007387 [Phoxinus phoxinus]|uniref:Ig-like domain-containing protein n=1 Tax=Phoxinus phoxinus TaxID=58324 RepID=A0AAN9D858_9TELE